MKVSTSLPAAECGIIAKDGEGWTFIPEPEMWIEEQLRAIGDVPLGPYVLALDYDSGTFGLIHATLFRKQVSNGADMESVGLVIIGSSAQVEWFTKAQEAGRKLVDEDK